MTDIGSRNLQILYFAFICDKMRKLQFKFIDKQKESCYNIF